MPLQSGATRRRRHDREVPIKKADFHRDTGVGAPLLGNESSIRTLAIAPRAHTAGSTIAYDVTSSRGKEEKEKKSFL